ncbi:MAG: hypothetical protein KUG56_04185 [Kordiimonadaceae bacterium]|nr:hypothetical protein [Kordiimonadaceae bacterium]
MTSKVAASRRPELLLLLAVLAGLLTSILFRPATEIINLALESLGDQQPNDETIEATTKIITRGFSTILLGQIALIAISAFLLPLWARAMGHKGLIPGDGGMLAFVARGMAAFQHIFIANALSVASMLIAVPVLVTLGTALGSMGSLLVMVAAFLLMWLMFAFTSVANFAIIHCAEDKNISYKNAWRQARPFLRPMTSFYATLWLTAGVINLLLSNLAAESLPDEIAMPLSLIISGTLSLLTNALHVAGLFSLPSLSAPLDET